MTSFRATPLLTLLFAAVLGVPASAQLAAAPHAATTLAVTADNRTAADAAAHGARRRDAAMHAGDVLRYRLVFTNTAGKPVRKVAIQNPVPAGLQFVAGSATASRPDARAEYSVDGGAAWSARPMESVIVGGRAIERPIAPERYTAVRWVVDGWVPPGATVTSEFEARLAAVHGAPAPGAGALGLR